MKQLEYNGRILPIPETIWEMDLEQFIDINDELAKQDESISSQMRLVSIVSRIPLQEIEEMDFNRFCEFAGICTVEDVKLPDVVTEEEAGVDETKRPIRFVVRDEKGKEHIYNFQPDYAFCKVKYIAKVEDILRGRDLMAHLHYVLALTAWKDGEIFDERLIENKAKLMLRARMEDVYRPLFFFALRGGRSSLLTRIFSRASKQAVRKERSAPVGDGTV